MTQQQKENLYYLTQYADNMSDEQLFEKIDNRAARYDLDLGLFIEIAEMMPMINQKLFADMLNAESDADLENIIKTLKRILMTIIFLS